MKHAIQKVTCFRIIAVALMCASILAFGGSLFAAEQAKPKPAGTESQPADAKKKPNMNQMAFIAKFDKNGDGRVDKTEFTGSHFSTFDKNGDGFIDPWEAPEGQTAY
jgi:hypothetical protein